MSQYNVSLTNAMKLQPPIRIAVMALAATIVVLPSAVNGGSTLTVAIGSSKKSNSKDAQFRDEGYNKIVCPTQVNKSNWLGSDANDDTFAITVSQASKTITATRTDASKGWGMDLRFTCTYSGTDVCKSSTSGYKQLNVRVADVKTNHIDGIWAGDPELEVYLGEESQCDAKRHEVIFDPFLRVRGCAQSKQIKVRTNTWYKNLNLDWKSPCQTGEEESNIRVILRELDDTSKDDIEMNQKILIRRYAYGDCESLSKPCQLAVEESGSEVNLIYWWSLPPPCGQGQYADALDCSECKNDTYMEESSHRHQKCNPQPECGKGQQISAPSAVEKQTCGECPPSTYNDQIRHRGNCNKQQRCRPGFKISAPLLTEKQTCSKCDDNTYIGAATIPSTTSTSTTASPGACPGESYFWRFQEETSDISDACTKADGGECWDEATEECIPAGSGTLAACTCCSAWDFDGSTYNGCAITPDDDSNAWCYTTAECSTSTPSSANPGRHWSNCELPSPSSSSSSSSTDHRIRNCTEQPSCGRGKFFKASPERDSLRSCLDCLENTYQNATKHRKLECIVQPECGKGQQISAPSAVEKQTCGECPPSTYNDQIRHRGNCTEQPRCPPGFKISAPLLTEEQTCSKCDDTTYIDAAADHRIQNCTEQVVCKPGFKISAKSTTKAQRCMPCENNTYMDETNHRTEDCKVQPACTAGYNITGSATTLAECNAVRGGVAGSSTAGNPSAAVGGAAAGFAAILLIAAVSAAVISRRNAAQRAEAALLEAEAIFDIPCGNSACPDARCIQLASKVSATAQPEDLERCSTCNSRIQFCMCSGSANDRARALTLASASQGQRRCIQKTSKGKGMTQNPLCTAFAIAGSNRCRKHTCEYVGCVRATPSNATFCELHENTPTTSLTVNPAFTGVLVLGSASDGLGSSSTDKPSAAAPTAGSQASLEAASSQSKFVAPVMVLGNGKWAAIGLTAIMGVDVRTYSDLTEEKAIQKMVAEFKKSAIAEHCDVLDGLIKGTYCNPGSTTPLPSLAEIMSTMEVVRLKKNGLQSHHVLAIRLYTTICYISINAPLRTHDKPHPQLPHPFAATMFYITDGLRKLLVASGDDPASSTDESILWRGVSDVGIADDFKSGTEMACMSTTADAKVAALEFANDQGFVFHIICNDYISRGQDISFLSVYPCEKEVLYPPLTYMNVDTGSQEVHRRAQALVDKLRLAKNLKPIKVVTVRPTYPKD